MSIRTLSTLHKAKSASTCFRQVRYAEVVNTPFMFFGGHHNNWERIKRISVEANRVKIDYDTKYALKLKQAAQKRGKTVDELKTEVLSKKNQNKLPTPIAAVKQPKVSPVPDKSKEPTSLSLNLDKIVKLDLLLKEDKQSIAKIWTQYHAEKDGICAVIPAATYAKLYETSKKYPLFILPISRETGLEFFFLQFQAHQCYFTSLLEYKTKGEKARPYLTITHFTELAQEKDIVMMRGDINSNPKKLLSTSNAHFLAFALQRFYSTDDPQKLKLVQVFNTAPEKFDYQELITEVEKDVSLQ